MPARLAPRHVRRHSTHGQTVAATGTGGLRLHARGNIDRGNRRSELGDRWEAPGCARLRPEILPTMSQIATPLLEAPGCARLRPEIRSGAPPARLKPARSGVLPRTPADSWRGTLQWKFIAKGAGSRPRAVGSSGIEHLSHLNLKPEGLCKVSGLLNPIILGFY
jgi:hypothetical protein